MKIKDIPSVHDQNQGFAVHTDYGITLFPTRELAEQFGDGEIAEVCALNHTTRMPMSFTPVDQSYSQLNGAILNVEIGCDSAPGA